MSLKFWKEYSEFEDSLRERFHLHGVFQRMQNMTDDEFRYYLLQIGFIARDFVKWYEVAKLGLDNEAAKKVIRKILNDEIPPKKPTHQDDRLHDLQLMGVSKERALTVKPSRASQFAVRRLYELVQVPQDHQDLRIMVTLRIAGEVLVAEQYWHIVREMRLRFGIKPEHSRFYAPHHDHDQKSNENGAGHTNAFDKVVSSMIFNDETLDVAKQQATRAFKARYNMQNQFLHAGR